MVVGAEPSAAAQGVLEHGVDIGRHGEAMLHFARMGAGLGAAHEFGLALAAVEPVEFRSEFSGLHHGRQGVGPQGQGHLALAPGDALGEIVDEHQGHLAPHSGGDEPLRMDAQFQRHTVGWVLRAGADEADSGHGVRGFEHGLARAGILGRLPGDAGHHLQRAHGVLEALGAVDRLANADEDGIVRSGHEVLQCEKRAVMKVRGPGKGARSPAA